ncbi:MAG: dihydroorotate dehydrogenase-like protein [Methylococcales bacterium]|nr:dihydroorotate dehydrogenase-like protein [Methylococcales bacterium]
MSAVDLTTRYLGLDLTSPLIAAASPLSRSLDNARQLEDAGAGALVMYSLFEEELTHQENATARFMIDQGIGFGEADSFLPFHDSAFQHGLEQYLDQVRTLKQALTIPVIASLNGVSLDGWIEHGRLLCEAGADALELNVYHLASDLDESGEAVERRYLELLTALKAEVTVPVAMKLSPYFSSPGHFIRRLAEAKADGVVLFNRFYQPDIDLDHQQVVSQLSRSRPDEIRLALRWLALLYRKTPLTLAGVGGVHSGADALKLLLAGADAVQLCSALLVQGPEYLATVKQQLVEQLALFDSDCLADVIGRFSQRQCHSPEVFERANYIHLIDSYNPAAGVHL